MKNKEEKNKIRKKIIRKAQRRKRESMEKDKKQNKNLINSKNKKTKHSKGITLVALVITIIVLIILAGVSINLVLGEDGIFKRAIGARETYTIASEREYLEQNVLLYQMQAVTNNDEKGKLGKPLYDRTVENSSIWDIIVEKENSNLYGTGWNYIEKGNSIEGYGEAKYHWLVNYETGEIIQLEEDSYNHLDYNSTVAVKDGLVFNYDSANANANIDSLGENTKLYYYDAQKYNTVESRAKAYEDEKEKNVTNYVGYDRQKSENINDYLDEKTGAFKFNGNNYIEIYNENGFDFSKGLTFEFYGNILGNTVATYNGTDTNWKNFAGLFGIWNGDYSQQCYPRFLNLFASQTLTYSLWATWNPGTQSGQYGDSNPLGSWNQHVSIGDIKSKQIYLFITIDNSKVDNDKINQSIYIYLDGTLKEYSGWLLKEYYDYFVEQVKGLHYFELGRCSYGTISNWGYLKGLCYSTRIYNKGLSKEEVQDNYRVTKLFHDNMITN